MSLLSRRESRPAGNGTATQESIAGQAPLTIPRAADNRQDDSPSAMFFRESYAVLVRGKSVRRHLYFNLPAAERAVKRARTRGDRADLVLVKLVPVDSRHLDHEEAHTW